jgi:hypothetical protein
MNTLSILDANTANIPEGLYLELTNALKKDFENNNNDSHYDSDGEISNYRRVNLLFGGWVDGVQHHIHGYRFYNEAVSYINDICDDALIAKHIFEETLKYGEYEMVYDVNTRTAHRKQYKCACCKEYDCDVRFCRSCDRDICEDCCDEYLLDGMICGECIQGANFQDIFDE